MNRAIGLFSVKRVNTLLLPRTYAITNDKHPKDKHTSSGEVNPADQQKNENDPEYQKRKKHFEDLHEHQKPEADR